MVYLICVLYVINEIICCLPQRQINLTTEIITGQHYNGINLLSKRISDILITLIIIIKKGFVPVLRNECVVELKWLNTEFTASGLPDQTLWATEVHKSFVNFPPQPFDQHVLYCIFAIHIISLFSPRCVRSQCSHR